MPDLQLTALQDAFLVNPTSANFTASITGESGTGALACVVSPSFTTPILGTPTSGTLTNCTIPVGQITGAGAGVLTWLATPSGANLATALTTALPATKGGTGLTALGTGVATALGVNANAGGGLIVLADPGADRIPFWDESANAFVFLTVSTGLDLTGTTLTATANANAVTLASAAAGAGLLIVSAGADRTATATDTVTTINATTANVTNLLPVVNDGAAIGASGTAFSDLYLASGAVINFNAGNVGITHNNAGTFLLVNPGDLRITSANVGTNADSVPTLSSTSTLTNKSIPVTVKITAASYTVGTTSPLELYGGVIFVTGAATITIPAVVDGQSFTVITEGAVAVSVDPNAADLIVLDGTALSDGDKITNLSTAGDMAVFVARDATGWSAQTNGWTDTN